MSAFGISQITDRLYLSGYRAINSSSIRDEGITHIVNVTSDMPNIPDDMPELEFIRLRVNDSPDFDLLSYFDIIADKIHNITTKGGKVLVHCMAGVSRSATLVIAYLMKYKNMNLRDAYDFVKTRRPIIHPNIGFFNQLSRYEQDLFASPSIQMINRPCSGMVPDVYIGGSKGLLWLDSVRDAVDRLVEDSNASTSHNDDDNGNKGGSSSNDD